MPTTRQRSADSDTNQSYLDKIALSVFLDMDIITQEQYDAAINGGVPAQIDLLQSIKDLEGKKAEDFSERFVDKILDENESWFDLVPPSTLAKAYVATREKLNNGDLSSAERIKFQNRLDKISNRIDSLVNDFANNVGYHFVDTTNIADVYAGYNEMFDAREPDLEQGSDEVAQIHSNRDALKEYMAAYDAEWGIESVDESEESVKSLTQNWDTASKKAKAYKPSESALSDASQYKFLDKNGAEIAQFKDENGNPAFDYQSGYVLDEEGRLAAIIDLMRHDFSLHHINDGNVGNKTTEEIQSEIDRKISDKLKEIYEVDKIKNGSVNYSISDAGFESAMDSYVNKTGGFAGRIKQKLGKYSGKATTLFVKIFKPISNIDKRRKDRIKGQSEKDKRQRRIDFFVRMLKGFGNAVLVSAAITVIASAAATLFGVSLAVSLAVSGILYASVMTAIQIKKWRKAQREAGKDDGIKAFLKDKRMLAMVGTTGIAAIAMIFGASGLTAAAQALGYGALSLGAGSNAFFTFQDAKKAGMSNGESISWSIANAVAVVAGGFAGRFIGNAVFDSYSNAHQGQNESTETRTVYNEQGLLNMEKIAHMWGDEQSLNKWQQMVDQYNAENGTNIDGNTSYVLSADAGMQTTDNMALHQNGGGVVHSNGHHTILTKAWANANHVDWNDVQTVANMGTDGQITPAEAAAYERLVSHLNIDNSASYFSGRAYHNDGVLGPNDTYRATDAVNNGGSQVGDQIYTSWHDGTPMVTHEPIHVDTNVDAVGAMGTFGNYNKETEADLKDRPGSLADRLVNDEPFVEPEPTPDPEPLPEPEPEPIPEPIKILPPHQENLILPERKEMLALPPHIEEPAPDKKYLRITLEQADALNYLPEDGVQKLRKELGIKSDEEMWDAQYWAYRKYDVEKTQSELESKIKMKASPEEIARLQAKLLEYKSEIPDDSRFYDHKYLTVTSPQAHALDANTDYNIPRTDEQLDNPNLQGSKRDKTDSKSKKYAQINRQVMNQLGQPSPSILHEGLYWAYRKELEELLSNPELHMKTSEKEAKIKKLKAKIAYWHDAMIGSRSEIPDEELFFDPVALQYDKESGGKIEKFKIAQRKLEALQAKRRAQQVNNAVFDKDNFEK